MTDKPIEEKSHAERLASFLEQMEQMFPNPQAANELRRLHEVNQALVGALKDLLEMPEADGTFSMGKLRKGIKDIAKDALAKAKEIT